MVLHDGSRADYVAWSLANEPTHDRVTIDSLVVPASPMALTAQVRGRCDLLILHYLDLDQLPDLGCSVVLAAGGSVVNRAVEPVVECDLQAELYGAPAVCTVRFALWAPRPVPVLLPTHGPGGRRWAFDLHGMGLPASVVPLDDERLPLLEGAPSTIPRRPQLPGQWLAIDRSGVLVGLSIAEIAQLLLFDVSSGSVARSAEDWERIRPWTWLPGQLARAWLRHLRSFIESTHPR